jgi:RES domain
VGILTRARQSLKAPPADARLDGFPRKTINPTRTLFRAHTKGNGPWWFSSAMNGRFDLPAPEGTCYVATTPAAALRERWGRKLVKRNMITEAFADATVLSTLNVPHSHRLADLCSSRAADFNVTREIHTVVRSSYQLTQQWAAALRRCRFQGIHYQARHATGESDHSIALFGDRGDAGWPDDPDPESGGSAAIKAGIKVKGIPRRISAAGLIPTPPATASAKR